MEYTRYFANIIKQYGALNLNQQALQCVFNVVHLEAQIDILSKISKHHYGMSIHKLKLKLDSITGKLEPRILHEFWYNGGIVRNKMELDPTHYNPWPERDPFALKKKKE